MTITLQTLPQWLFLHLPLLLWWFLRQLKHGQVGKFLIDTKQNSTPSCKYIKMKCPVSVSLVFLQVTARQVKRGMVRSKVKKRSWWVFDNVDFKSQHRAAACPMLQSSLKQWRFSNQLQGVLMSPQVRFSMFNVTFVTLAMSQSFVSSHSVCVLHPIPVWCNEDDNDNSRSQPVCVLREVPHRVLVSWEESDWHCPAP